MKPYTPNQTDHDGAVRILHTLRPGVEIKAMEELHRLLEQESCRNLTRPDVLRIAVARELERMREKLSTSN